MCIGLFIALTTQAMAQPSPGDTGIDTGKVVLTGWGSNETGQIYNMNYSSLTPPLDLTSRANGSCGSRSILPENMCVTNTFVRQSVSQAGCGMMNIQLNFDNQMAPIL